MADIFLSYKREDREKVRPIVDALQAKGWTVWWDTRIGAGEVLGPGDRGRAQGREVRGGGVDQALRRVRLGESGGPRCPRAQMPDPDHHRRRRPALDLQDDAGNRPDALDGGPRRPELRPCLRGHRAGGRRGTACRPSRQPQPPTTAVPSAQCRKAAAEARWQPHRAVGGHRHRRGRRGGSRGGWILHAGAAKSPHRSKAAG